MTERFSKESAADELAAHPAAELFPLLDEEGIQPLVSDIGQNGLQNPIVLHEGKILDGRNRYRACLRAGVEPQFVEWEDPGCGPNHWVISQNLIRRHLTASQRAVIALDVLPMFEKEARERQGARIDITAQMPEGSGEARKHAAKALIVSPRYVSEAKKIAAAAPDLIVAIRCGKKTIKDAKRELIRRERDVHKTMLLTGLPPLSERYQLYNRDIADIPEFIDANSVDVIITDPPYSRDSLELYAQLAETAEHCLREGGSAVVLCGQVLLPEILDVMREHLTYHWTLCYDMPGARHQMFQKHVVNGWKPILWLVKGQYDGEMIADKVAAGECEKDLHDWQQSEPGFAELVERFSDPGQTILDPFMGSGTTGVVTLKARRQFIGVEIDKGTFATAHRRIHDVKEN